MKHPRSRAERRAVRSAYIARRKFIRQHIWYKVDQVPHEGSPAYQQEPGWFIPFLWGRYAKFNLRCTCRPCMYQHSLRDDSHRALVQRARERDGIEEAGLDHTR